MKHEIISKSEAMARGLNHYFTGAACKNGHVARRYIQSSACVECVNGDRIITDAQREARFAERQEKLDWQRRRIQMAEQRLKQRQEEQAQRLQMAAERLELKKQATSITNDNRAVRGVSVAARSQLIKTKIIIPITDLPAMKAFVHGLASLRIPGIRVIDIYPSLTIKEGGWIHTFLVHPDDRELVFQAQDEFMKPVRQEAEQYTIQKLEENNRRLARSMGVDNGDPGDTLENLMR